jgi:hypothetical protein
MSVRKHPEEFELALYTSGDVSLGRSFALRFHISRCESCSRIVQAYRADRKWLGEKAGELPEGVNWDRLSAEMTANIRVGLAAGECVAPRSRKSATWGWRPVAAAAGLTVLVMGAWWLNVPTAQNESLSRAFQSIVRRGATLTEDRRPTVVVTPTEIKLFENGGSLGMVQGSLRPVAVSVNAEGSASARYVDADTGQVTITSVYVQ